MTEREKRIECIKENIAEFGCIADRDHEQWLIEELTKEMERSKKLREALEFYANKNNWNDRWIDEDPDREGDIFDIIDRDDVLELEDEHGPYLSHGGNKAREALASYDQSCAEGES